MGVPPEKLREIVSILVAERREMRQRGESPVTIEANRLAIEYWQRELARCLGRSSGSAPAGAERHLRAIPE